MYSVPKICPICGGELGGPSSHSDWCETCDTMFVEFNRVMPEAWRKVTHGHKLSFVRWQAMMRIKKAVFDGSITEEEGKRQTKELAQQVERDFVYKPMTEAQLRQQSAQTAAKPRTIFNMPSLLE